MSAIIIGFPQMPGIDRRRSKALADFRAAMLERYRPEVADKMVAIVRPLLDRTISPGQPPG
jgi:hypothetical protein